MGGDENGDTVLIVGNEENDLVQKGRKWTKTVDNRNISIMCFTAFVGSVSFSVVMSSLWPYMKRIDKHVSETYLGLINSCYSVAELVFSVIFGYWCDRRQSTEPLVVSIIMYLMGCSFYAYAEAFGPDGIWVILVARIMLGVSAGNISICRTEGTRLSTSGDRARTLAKLCMWQSIGFFTGPGIQAAVKPIGFGGIYVPSLKLHLDIYTAPCYIMILLGIANIILLLRYYDNGVKAKKRCNEKEKEVTSANTMNSHLTDKWAIAILLILHFVACSAFALTETILSPILMSLLGWTHQAALFYGAIILGAVGVVAMISMLLVGPVAKIWSERVIIASSLFVTLCGYIIWMPWGPGNVSLTKLQQGRTNGTDMLGQASTGGCPYQYKWCHDTKKLPLPQFIVGTTVLFIGIPISTILIITLYSKMIGPSRQAIYMGWLSGVGCLARAIGPLYITTIYIHAGALWMLVCTSNGIGLSIILFLIGWKRFTPIKLHHDSNTLSSTERYD